MTNWMTAAGIAFIAGGLATLISLRSVLIGRAEKAAEHPPARDGVAKRSNPAERADRPLIRPDHPAPGPDQPGKGRSAAVDNAETAMLPPIPFEAPGHPNRPASAEGQKRQERRNRQGRRSGEYARGAGGLDSIGFAEADFADPDFPEPDLSDLGLGEAGLVEEARHAAETDEEGPAEADELRYAEVEELQYQDEPRHAEIEEEGAQFQVARVEEFARPDPRDPAGDRGSSITAYPVSGLRAPRIPTHRPAALEPGDEQAAPIPVRRVDRTDRGYGDRVDDWVRPEYHEEPPVGEYWTPVPDDQLDYELPESDPEPSARGYGWPIPVERLPAVPDYEPATGFDLIPVSDEETEMVPIWPPMPPAADERPGRSIRLPASWSNRNEKPADDNRFAEDASPPADGPRFRMPTGEPERRRPRPRPRPAKAEEPARDPDTFYVSRHAADPPQ